MSVIEDASTITVNFGDGLNYQFAKGSAGYTSIFTESGSQVVMNEQWNLQYLRGPQWRQRGVPLDTTWSRESASSVRVTRFYDDYLGTTWNVTYWFQSGVHPKLTFKGFIAQEEDYRIVWSLSGINKTFYEAQSNRVEFWNTGDTGNFTVDVFDVYVHFGDISSVNIEAQANNHKLDYTFAIGMQQGAFELDPFFGKTDTGASAIDSDDLITGSLYTLSETGTINLISIDSYVGASGAIRITAMIYDDALNLVVEADELYPDPSERIWHNVSVTGDPELSAGDYYVCSWFGGSGSYIYYDAGTTDQFGRDALSYDFGNAPDPWVPDSYNDYAQAIYADYTASGGGTTYEIDVTQGLSTSYNVAIEWIANVATTQALSSAYAVGVDFTMEIATTLGLSVSDVAGVGWDLSVAVTQGVSSAYTVLSGLTYEVATSLGVTIASVVAAVQTEASVALWYFAFIIAIVALAIFVMQLVSKA